MKANGGKETKPSTNFRHENARIKNLAGESARIVGINVPRLRIICTAFRQPNFTRPRAAGGVAIDTHRPRAGNEGTSPGHWRATARPGGAGQVSRGCLRPSQPAFSSVCHVGRIHRAVRPNGTLRESFAPRSQSAINLSCHLSVSRSFRGRSHRLRSEVRLQSISEL